MIQILYTRIRTRLNNTSFDFYLRQLPPDQRSKILRYRKWQDAHRSLLGRALLIRGLRDLRVSLSLADLKYTEFDRPYFEHSIDFNISHAGEYVICAISTGGIIGIDVEEIAEVPLEDFDSNFSKKEWDEILNGNNRMERFYHFWTKKEAFLKAKGMGLNVPLNEAEILGDKICWDNKEWFLHEIKLDKEYICHFASENSRPDVRIRETTFD